jgi:hypothetical protein
MKVCSNSKPWEVENNRDQKLTKNNFQVQRDHKKAEAAGTRAPVKANGLPVKAPKPTSLVRSSSTIPFSRELRGLRR